MIKYIVKNITLNRTLYEYTYTRYDMALHTAQVLTKRSVWAGTNYKFTVLEIEI